MQSEIEHEQQIDKLVKIQKIIKKYAMESGDISDNSLKVNTLLTHDLSKISPHFVNETNTHS